MTTNACVVICVATDCQLTWVICQLLSLREIDVSRTERVVNCITKQFMSLD